ncbi:EAL domain-containing protein [Comamonas sp. Y33R10-2]|uniref:putative bifunctional diguanylate cyclase/phosphodiesterase n=1 Tax=Comamonas sp. Y33R10-2 TaxID=2853257 RepID=UPI001C5CA1F8|nr:GGDEF domain-containing phosphodiesterase [Comamonas sp. Y33R10-2]QXZ10454.1 EAL domain-containing protein [Comamonas sp. Y33R10-2]
MQRLFVEARYRLPMRRMVWLASLWMLGLGALMTLVWVLSDVLDPWGVGITLSMMLLSLVCMGLARARQWDWMVRCFVWGHWLLAVLLIWRSGGFYSPAVIAFAAWLVITVWVQGLLASIFMFAASIAVLGAFWGVPPVIYEQPALQRTTALMGLIHVPGMLVLALAMSLQARMILWRRVQKGQQMLATLNASQHELSKFYFAVEQNPESIVITDTTLTVVYVNDAFLARTGYRREQVLGHPTESVSTNGMDFGSRQRALAQLAAGEVWRGEMTNRASNGEALRESLLIAPIRTPNGEVVNYVELKRDLSERVLAERRIHDLVYLDPLTGLPNRHSLTLYLRELIHTQQDDCHGLLLLDMDRFSAFNGVHGSQHSDELIALMGARLVQVLPDDAWIARIAAAEFAIVFASLHRHAEGVTDQLRQYAQTLKKSLQTPFSLNSWVETELVSCCMGGVVLESARRGGNGNDALRFASVALREAKQKGPGSLVFFEPRMAQDVDRRMRIAKDLHNGIPLGELRMYLQTQTDGRGHCVGAEVLVRWQHPKWGLVSPAEFIPVAEETDLIVLLGDWVLRQACLLLATPALLARGLRLSVNVSAFQFGHENFMTSLEQVLQETGANPHQLTLEITEGAVVRDIDQARIRIEALTRMGIETSLDDFGTGYSSMYSLQRLPIQELKIDQSFVSGSHRSEKDAALVEAMLLMARRLRLRVVAEGVELSEQALQLVQWNPDIVLQGMLLGKPLPQQQWLVDVLGVDLSDMKSDVWSAGQSAA